MTNDQRTILLTLFFSLGTLLSACDVGESPSSELTEDLPEGFIAVENHDGLAAAALEDDALACFWEDADYEVTGFCVIDDGRTGTFDYPQLAEAWNDRISSVELRPGVSANLFTDSEFQGEALELTASSTYIGDTFNDEVSSFNVVVPPADEDEGEDGDNDAEGTFDIQLRFNGEVTDSQRAAFENAAQRWSSLITQAIGTPETVNIPENACFTETNGAFFEGLPAFDGTITSVLIDVQIEEIDGLEGTLGQAGPCLIRTETNNLPSYGAMEFDVADTNVLEDDGVFEDIVLHEMGHVLGVGTLWELGRSLTVGVPATGCGTDPQFVGTNAVREWQALGGQGNVPLEESDVIGSCDRHWAENTFGDELMTPEVNGATSLPLSRLTVASVEDLGYSVDYDAADPYQLPTGNLNTQNAEPGLNFELEHPTSFGSFEDYITP